MINFIWLARKDKPRVQQGRKTCEQAMMCKVRAVFAMFLSVAFSIAFNQAFAQSGPTHHGRSFHHGGSFHHGRSFAVMHLPHHRFPHHIHHRRNMGFFPAIGGFWGVPNDGFGAGAYAPTFDATPGPPLWSRGGHTDPDPDPPSVAVVRRPGCVSEVVTVPGADGKDQTITMVRC